jgi:hypothetical protein
VTERVRVTSPRTTSGRRHPPPSAAHEIDAQSQVGEVYLRSLLRAQLRLAVVVVVLLAVLVGGLPLVFLLLPQVSEAHVLGMPLAWGLLGFLVYPTLVAIGWWYVRAAERNERAFTDVVQRPASHPARNP